MHDIYYVERAPNTKPINICAAGDRIGTPYIPSDPSKIVAIIESDAVDEGIPDSPADPEYEKMSELLVDFLKKEVKEGRMCNPLPPLQAGVGAVSNAVFSGLNKSGILRFIQK